MARARRIGILTGGGDVPGLNSVIKSVVYRSTELGYTVVGIRRGWRGLTHLSSAGLLDSDNVRPLDRSSTRTIDRTGGTILHTSRTNPRRMHRGSLPASLAENRLADLQVDDDSFDLTPVVLDSLERLGIDTLIPIGGDDTLSYAAVLATHGVPLVAIPKTMDNDVSGTEYCLGFSTAVTRAKELINRQRTTLGSHERIGVFRIFGRNAGFTALATAYVTSARCVIPEAPFALDRLIELLAADRLGNPSTYALVIASEGAMWEGGRLGEFGPADAYGHRRKMDVGFALAEEIQRRTGVESVSAELTYDLRSGEPDALDQMVATTFANVAMDLVAAGTAGRMIAVRGGRYDHAPLPAAEGGARTVNIDREYDADRFRPAYIGRLGQPVLLHGGFVTD